MSRLDDCIESYYSGDFTYLGFLNESEIAICSAYLRNRYVDFSLYGGYPDSTRAFIILGTDVDIDRVPIRPLMISDNSCDELTHRDYLGSLMGLGIKRECIGDIRILQKGKAVIFVKEEIARYIINELKNVKRALVSVCEYMGNSQELQGDT